MPERSNMTALVDAILSGSKPRWQESHAQRDWNSRLTKLTPGEQLQYQFWLSQTGAPDTPDYDMPGFWRSRLWEGDGGTSVNPNDNLLHYPDTYKTPLHKTFSAESRYADPSSAPPHWNDRDQLVSSSGRILYDERAKSRR